MRHFSRMLSILVCAIAFGASPALHALTWVEVARLTHAGGSANDFFGYSVAIDGDVAVIGEINGNDPNGVERAGVAHVFVRSGGTWSAAAELLPSDSAAGDLFGASVAIRGDTIAVGSPTLHTAHDGFVYVFVRPGGGWSGTLSENARLDATGLGGNFQLGDAVAFAGDSIVTNSNVVRNILLVFNKPISGWSGIVAPNAILDCTLNGGALFSVAASGDVVIAGNGGENIGNLQMAGKAFVWVKPGGGWIGFIPNVAELLPSDPIDLGEFGEAVAIDGTTALVTNRYGNGFPATPNNSKGYVFEQPVPGWAGTLTENAQLVGSDVINGEQFGTAASLSGGTAVIGALGADFSQGQAFGAAYVFDRPSSGWSGTVSETTKFSGPQGGTDPPDWFGSAVAISGNTILVGAMFENVNGNFRQGAAHVFELREPPFRVRIRFLVKGPVRVAPGVPVEFSFHVETLGGEPIAPSGEVVVSDGVGQACRAELSSSGEGACMLTLPGAGLYRVRANYEGNAEFAATTSPPLVVFVGTVGGGP